MTTTTLAQLDTRHTGKTIRLHDLTGTLQGVISVADRVQLAVITGPTRTWTSWMDASTVVEVLDEETAMTCSVDACTGALKTRKPALCEAHYRRLRLYGSPTGTPARPTEKERFLAKVAKSDGCWEWTASIDVLTGYGRFKSKDTSWAHRVSYTLFVGPIPPDFQIDHLCRNRKCVRPDHLEAVPQRVNILRGETPAALATRTNRCKRDHEFTPENTYYRPDGRGRECRACTRIRAGRQPDYPADTRIEVGIDLEPTCSWCDANRHERCRGTDGCGCPCARRDEHP